MGLSIRLQAQGDSRQPYFHWETITKLPAVGNQSAPLGVAGPIAGMHKDKLIVAGGANFDQPVWDNNKVWHNDIWIWNGSSWESGDTLDHPIAYSAVVSTPLGIIAMGGCDARTVYSEVRLLRWDEQQHGGVVQEMLPSLPRACAYGSAAMIGEHIYLAGGTEGLELSTAMKNIWRLDLGRYGRPDFQWEELPPWPGPARAFSLTLAQHNGYTDCLYLMGGRRQGESPSQWEVLQDVYEFNPGKLKESPWRRRADMPAARMAGTGIPVGQSHLFILSGADGSLYQQADSLKDQHPGFPKQILGYHTITNSWFDAGEMPANHVTTHAFADGDKFVIASGEIKPRTRSPQLWHIKAIRTSAIFGWENILAIVLYLLVLVGIGIYFSFRNQTTDDFFRGGQRVPWWAAGCSIFATMLSSLTFMSVPAKTFATDWLYFLINMAIIALAPFIIYFILPFFRRIDATSAYQYLELRFNLATRLFASTSYILFQIGRMAIVMYLPALALSAVTPLSIEASILIMGGLSILYCTLGGLEAVIWTDTLQTFVLLGGALLSFFLIVLSPEIGFGTYLDLAGENDKFRMIDWSWDYTGTALWVIILGGLGQTLIPYSSDQGVVQRYMSVSDVGKAKKSIWTNAVLSFVATLLFFSLGTALYIFYLKNPDKLDPTFQTDAVFPLFIARQLPAGLAGLVIAGIFAAAQSTVSTSMNSIATVSTTDFARRFGWRSSEKEYLRLARGLTILFGLLGTAFALVIAYADIKSLWDSFLGILGLFGGAMCGLFMLGIFSTKANGKGAIIGAIAGAICLWLVQQYTDVSFLLYATVGIVATYLFGLGASMFFPQDKQNIEGLTIHSLTSS
ncbi:MAG: sodium/solute symporter [Bacteroidota bacterium]